MGKSQVLTHKISFFAWFCGVFSLRFNVFLSGCYIIFTIKTNHVKPITFIIIMEVTSVIHTEVSLD
jgi:hypothetical protein